MALGSDLRFQEVHWLPVENGLGEEIKCEPVGVPGFHTTAQPPTAKSVPESSVEHSLGEPW